MPGRPRKQRIRAPHERQFPNRVSRAGVEMTCQNCFEKGHNKSSCTKPTVTPPTKQPAKRGRPKKNVVTVVDYGDYTFDMGSAGVEAETMVIEDGIPRDTTVTSANLGEFVSVRCEGATSFRVREDWQQVKAHHLQEQGTSGSMSTARGRGRGRGRQTLGVKNGRLERSERIMKKRLSSSIDGPGSSNTNPQA
ncbi:hypothetical protein Tco_0798290 [Tanacetum coccineum]